MLTSFAPARLSLERSPAVPCPSRFPSCSQRHTTPTTRRRAPTARTPLQRLRRWDTRATRTRQAPHTRRVRALPRANCPSEFAHARSLACARPRAQAPPPAYAPGPPQAPPPAAAGPNPYQAPQAPKPQEYQRTATVRNQVNLKKGTLKLEKAAGAEDVLAITFKFDATAAGRCACLLRGAAVACTLVRLFRQQQAEWRC